MRRAAPKAAISHQAGDPRFTPVGLCLGGQVRPRQLRRFIRHQTNLRQIGRPAVAFGVLLAHYRGRE
ncbi:hypothetical protein CHELA40_12099 [Chelatococcus asaccharovorans]|nr:hypothetical protein CHELA40_12099 [Chelatococcus asaccharovorans]CAH1683449.1 hypothetical protein CHELA17_63505 [Chelatococcus asaccharovorans]